MVIKRASTANVYEMGLRLPQNFRRQKADRALFDKLLKSAKDSYECREYAQAIETYRKALKLFLNEKSVALLKCYIAGCYYLMGDSLTAENYITEAYKMDPNSIEIKITGGVIYISSKNHVVNGIGVDWLKKAFRIDQKNQTVLYHLSMHYYFIYKNYEAASKYLKIIEKNVEDNYAEGEFVYQLTINSSLYNKYLDIISNDFRMERDGTRVKRYSLLVSLADFSLRLDNYLIHKIAIKMLEKAIEISPIDLKVLYHLTNAAFHQNNYRNMELHANRFKMFCNIEAKCQIYPSLKDVEYWGAMHKHSADKQECSVQPTITLVEMHLDFKRYQFNDYIGIIWELLNKSSQLLPNHPVLMYHLINVSFFKQLYKDVCELTIRSHAYIKSILPEKLNYYKAIYIEVLGKLDEFSIENQEELIDALTALAALHSGSEIQIAKELGFELVKKAYKRERTNRIVLYHLAVICFINGKYSKVDPFSCLDFVFLTIGEHFEHKLMAKNFVRNIYKESIERTFQDTNLKCIEGAQSLLKILSIKRLPENDELSALVYEKIHKYYRPRLLDMERSLKKLD